MQLQIQVTFDVRVLLMFCLLFYGVFLIVLSANLTHLLFINVCLPFCNFLPVFKLLDVQCSLQTCFQVLFRIC